MSQSEYPRRPKRVSRVGDFLCGIGIILSLVSASATMPMSWLVVSVSCVFVVLIIFVRYRPTKVINVRRKTET
jgi:hypothetical protein